MGVEAAVKHRRGRPPLSEREPSTDVCLKLPVSIYDRAYKEAAKLHVTVPEVIRRALCRELSDDHGAPLARNLAI